MTRLMQHEVARHYTSCNGNVKATSLTDLEQDGLNGDKPVMSFAINR